MIQKFTRSNCNLHLTNLEQQYFARRFFQLIFSIQNKIKQHKKSSLILSFKQHFYQLTSLPPLSLQQNFMDSQQRQAPYCLQSLGFQRMQNDLSINFQNQTCLNPQVHQDYAPSELCCRFLSLDYWSFPQSVKNKYSISRLNKISKPSSINSIFLYLAFSILVLLVILFGAYLKIGFLSQLPHDELRLLQQEATQNQSFENKSKIVQDSTLDFDSMDIIETDNDTLIEQNEQIYDEGLQNSTSEQNQSQLSEGSEGFEGQNGSNSSEIFDDFNSTEDQSIKRFLNDPTIEWPQQNEQYHIYTAMQPRLVLGIDGYRDMILYDWNTQLYEMYYFKKVYSNLYYIINAESNQYMATPQRFVSNTNLSKVRFSKDQRKLWKLIPALNHVKNSFHIVSMQDQAVSIHLRYWSIEKLAEIVQSKFQKNTSQVWVLRKNTPMINFEDNKFERYEQKLSQVYQSVMHNFYSINEAITFEELKTQMYLQNVSYPLWMDKPIQHNIAQYDLPFEIDERVFSTFLKKSHIMSQIQPLSESSKEQVTDKDTQDEQQNTQGQIQKQKRKNLQFNHLYVTTQCAKNHKIAYIWYGKSQMPNQYKYLLHKCRQNVVLLKQQEFQSYVTEWNKFSQPQYQITPDLLPIRQRVNILKLLYLYFESGIYADFDTQINEKCFDKVFSNEIIFTNRMQDRNPLPYYFLPIDGIITPEQSFMMVRQKFNPQVKRMIEQKILEPMGQGDRWRQCKYRQCLIVQCQRHYRDNTYRKGYN